MPSNIPPALTLFSLYASFISSDLGTDAPKVARKSLLMVIKVLKNKNKKTLSYQFESVSSPTSGTRLFTNQLSLMRLHLRLMECRLRS